MKIGLTVLAMVCGCVAFVMVGDSWWQLGTAVFFAVMFAQFAFLGHDAGHKQIFRRSRRRSVPADPTGEGSAT